MKNYLKRSQANAGQKFIIDADEGDFYLMLASVYSDEYHFNKSLVQQKVAESVVGGDYKNQKAMFHAQMCAAAITEWSVPEEYGECTPENAEAFLYEYPQIAQAVDAFISNDRNYVEKK